MVPKMAKRTVKPKPPQGSAQIQLENRPDTPFYYANYVAVSHSPYEFTLSVAKVPNPLTRELMEFVSAGKAIPVEPTLQIIIPTLLVEGLIKALIDQKQKQEKTLQQQVKTNDIEHKHIKLPDPVN
jgi:hypothetical protein